MLLQFEPNYLFIIRLILSHIHFFIAAQESKYDFQVQLSEEKICKQQFDSTIFLLCLMQPFMSSRYRHSLFPIRKNMAVNDKTSL